MVEPSRQPNPETFAGNRLEVEKRVVKALRVGGIDIPSGRLTKALVDLVIAERVEVRTTAADRIVGPIVGRYETIDDDLLERLAYTLEFYYVDDRGGIQISFPDGDK